MNNTTDKAYSKQVYDDEEFPTKASPREYEIIHFMAVTYAYWHCAGFYGLFCINYVTWSTIIFLSIVHMLAEIGANAGAHRLWSHRAYKAKLPLQILLMVMQSISCQYTATNWVRDHRMHHKYTDTDADPHNANRGFFYSHFGWLVVKKHSEIRMRGHTIDMSDIYSNSVLMFQKKYSMLVIGSFSFIIPTLITMYCFGETLSNAWHVNALRLILSMQATLLINSAAHMWGHKPYDKSILPSQNHFVSLVTLGEGFHNYHHAFPWDYRAAELGNNYLNLSTKFIDLFAWIGWAYDLKVAPDNIVNQRKQRTGDGTNLWGFEDKDLPEQRKEDAKISSEKHKLSIF